MLRTLELFSDFRSYETDSLWRKWQELLSSPDALLKVRKVQRTRTFYLSARGGSSDPANLAWSCLGCNSRKSDRTEAVNPLTRERAAFFNPRAPVWSFGSGSVCQPDLGISWVKLAT
jgi:hypothetical protein